MKERKIYESVPGKQVSLAHIITNPDKRLFKKIGLPESYSALGILTITPGEVAIIASDVAKKSAGIKLGFVDRFSGSIFIMGDVSAVKESMEATIRFLRDTMLFYTVPITSY